MKNYSLSFLLAIALLVIFGCKNEETNTGGVEIKDVELKVSFQENKAASILKSATALIKETPTNYYIGLKSARLIGSNGTADAELFNKPNLSSSLVFDFTNNSTVHSLLNGSTIPQGNYSSIEFEIYYLQMNIAVATKTRGIERRNVRIYLSDDAETEGGLHQPGDLTQIENSQEVGWLRFAIMEPRTPRKVAYSIDGGVTWMIFDDGTSAKDVGPAGGVNIINNASLHPIYKLYYLFVLVEGKGTKIIVDFNVNGCWQFEDKNGDGVFGPLDMDNVEPKGCGMMFPAITVTQN